jgi:hypothetical protein
MLLQEDLTIVEDSKVESKQQIRAPEQKPQLRRPYLAGYEQTCHYNVYYSRPNIAGQISL